MTGRPRCGILAVGVLSATLNDHIFGDVAKLLPYSELNFRRRAKWAELHKNRVCLADVLTASSGYQLNPTYTTAEVIATVKDKDIASTADACEKYGYRLRAQLSHLMAARKNTWAPPQKFDAVRGLINMTRVDEPVPQQGLNKRS